MSLDVLANHIASQGRGRDSALIHMSPNEIESLRALAQAHGGDLTINPETGLPEAGFLEDILPAVAGFALDTFVPGLGEMTGLGSFAAPAIVGGIAALTNGGDWEKGLMAGLGAYGGASLSQGLAGAGATAIGNQATEAAMKQAAEQGLAGEAAKQFAAEQAAAAMRAAGTGDTLAAGFNAATGAPIDFLKKNKWGLAALAAPALMSGMGKEQDSGAPPLDPGNIRPYDYDPSTQRYTALPTYKAHYAWGGDVVADALRGVESSANLKSAIAPKAGGEDSKAVYDYLMGRGPNPYLSRNTSSLIPDKEADSGVDLTNDTTTKSSTAALPKILPASTTNDSGREYTLDPHVAEFLANETTAERNARMSNVNNLLTVGSQMFSPLSTMVKNAGPYVLGKIANWASTPKTAEEVQRTPVDDSYLMSSLGNLGITGTYDISTGDRDLVGKDGGSGAGVSLGGSGIGLSLGAQGSGLSLNASDLGKGLDVTGADGRDSGGGGRGEPGGGNQGGGHSGAGNDRDAVGGWYHNGKFNQPAYATGGITALAAGGVGHLGSYSDGGRLLRGPGDGVSDDIPATIGHGKEPARLADGEFVVPARIVSELGNGSTEAGARKLYQMMDRIQANRRKTVGKGKVAVNSKAERYLPA